MTLRILLVEDNPGDARLFREAAAEAVAPAVDIRHVTRLEDALAALASPDFDIVVSDLGLPDSQGLATVTQLHSAAPSLPVVVLTGSRDEAFEVEVLRSGADDYLTKGRYNSETLMRALRYAIERKLIVNRAEHALREEARVVEMLQRIGGGLAAELDVERVVQTVTDEATVLAGAQFGAFFYNVINQAGESYTLYTLSGVPRSAFEKFPMPRNTAVFNPTFTGAGVLRSDDITQDERYGKSAPHHGMPPGHLPLRSYLAVPVISRSGEVLGGLFFGHPDVAVFDDRAERIVSGIAGWAAVAMDNARLYEAERRAREEAEKANRVKSEFLATMSHELRTPLNAMLGYTDLWLLGVPAALPAPILPQVERVRHSAKHLLELIEEILTFARVEAAQEKLELDKWELAQLIETVAAFIEPLALQKKLKFSLEAPPDRLEMFTDVRKVRQILINLLSNAVKFTDNGTVSLGVTLVGDTVQFEVRDSGIGIAAEHLDKIFEPFWQVGFGPAARPGGTGLGLSVTRKLAHLLGGDVKVESTHGEGSRFQVTLPVRTPIPPDLPPHAIA